MAPTIGPTLWAGGLLSTIPGGGSFLSTCRSDWLTWFLVRRFVEDPPYFQGCAGRLAFKLDYIGIALLTLGIGALPMLLDKGAGRRLVWMLHHHSRCCRRRVPWHLPGDTGKWFQKAPIIDVRMFKSF